MRSSASIVAFRCDATDLIGSGHLMRCLRLALNLKSRKISPVFVLNNPNKFAIELLKKNDIKSFEIVSGSKKFDPSDYSSWLSNTTEEDARLTKQVLDSPVNIRAIVVDHYGIDAAWHLEFDQPIVVIDDLANRPLQGSMLVDSNEYVDFEKRYNGIVNDTALQLLGARFALLDKTIAIERGTLNLSPKCQFRKVFVCFGGSDPTGETLKVLKELRGYSGNLLLEVVVGPMSRDYEEINSLAADLPFVIVHKDPTNLYSIMAGCDFALGAGGTMTWERAALGLPMTLVSVADNQVELCKDLKELGYIEYLGHHKGLRAGSYANVIQGIEAGKLAPNFEKLFLICDGKGVERVCDKIVKL
jgi:UDP-2,4-diacetamido-2,4,6-trideoxy-beta-L-altropyranose hydrolase